MHKLQIPSRDIRFNQKKSIYESEISLSDYIKELYETDKVNVIYIKKTNYGKKIYDLL